MLKLCENTQNVWSGSVSSAPGLPFMCFHDLLAMLGATLGFIKSLVSVNVLAFQHQQAASLAFISGPAG